MPKFKFFSREGFKKAVGFLFYRGYTSEHMAVDCASSIRTWCVSPPLTAFFVTKWQLIVSTAKAFWAYLVVAGGIAVKALMEAFDALVHAIASVLH